MKKLLRSLFIFLLLLTGFSFIENQRVLCGTWSSPIYTNIPVRGKTGVDTLHIKRNGKFILKKFSTISLPGIYIGKWTIQKDSLILLADMGGIFIIDDKGRPLAEKLKEKRTFKLSITMHSYEEIYLSNNNCNFSRITKKADF